jgi:hypothetical protein
MSDRDVVVVKLIGGLGNQMFQYAAGRAVAHRHGVPLLLDTSGFASYELRRYELDGLAICADIANEEQRPKLTGTAGKRNVWSALERWLAGALSQTVLREASFTYDARIETAKPPVYLDGYWQSEKYFFDLAQILRQEFEIRDRLDDPNCEMLQQIKAVGRSAVSLHVRRGDYVSNSHTAQYHGVCSMDYYRAAVKRMSHDVVTPHFFIFSDDHTWVQENLDLEHASTLVKVNDADHGTFDLTLMKSCAHHVIANSSFSWWGAWLNPSNEKIVIAPSQWFARASNDTRDLLPASWIQL